MLNARIEFTFSHRLALRRIYRITLAMVWGGYAAAAGCTGAIKSHDDHQEAGGLFGTDSGPRPPVPACPGREITLTGRVMAPNGVDAVAGATVYRPWRVPLPFSGGIRCDTCGAGEVFQSFVRTQTKADGSFRLEGLCPGLVPIVLQNGRFRRVLEVMLTEKTPIVHLTPNQRRLPRRVGEFHPADAVPRIAVATGDYDKMECVLRRMGLDDSTLDLYENAHARRDPAPLPDLSRLLTDLNRMKSYHLIVLNCTERTFSDQTDPALIRRNLNAYLRAGGRLYVTDLAYGWIEEVPELAGAIDFEPGASQGIISEREGAARLGAGGVRINPMIADPVLTDWLSHGVDQATRADEIQYFLDGWVMVRAAAANTKVWVSGVAGSKDGSVAARERPLTVTFDVGSCGRVLFSSYHTEGRGHEAEPIFPGYCASALPGADDPKVISTQEHILQYLLFDISTCNQAID